MTSDQAHRGRSEADVKIGIRLTRAMLQRNVSATKIALAIDVPEETVERYCAGQERIGAKRLVQICEVLGVGVEWFFKE